MEGEGKELVYHLARQNAGALYNAWSFGSFPHLLERNVL